MKAETHTITNTPEELGRLRHWLLAAAIMIFLVIVMGGMVRVSNAGEACPGWPLCNGQLAPPEGPLGVLAYLHRLATALVTPPLLIAAWFAWRRHRSDRWISLPVFLAAGLLLVSILVGGVMALVATPAAITTVHLGFSLLLFGLVLFSTVVAYYRHAGPRSAPARLSLRSPYSRLALLNLFLVFALLVSGAFVVASGSSGACQGWPLCGGLPGSAQAWIELGHRFIVALSGLALLALLVQAWRTQRTQTPVIVSATAAAALFLAQALMGAMQVHQQFPPHLLALHTATATAVWAALVVNLTAVGMAGRTAEEERLEARSITGRSPARVALDMLALTKPIVVALLLVTTFAGMVIGAEAWPSMQVTFWTLLGGFLAAGGSGAINQYIDRLDDIRMQRTQKRPIPSGRMTPGEGLAFGVGIAIASFYFMVAFVNMLAALLSLAGIIYYVLIYSIFLKKTTVQNIVIGGGAGAIPPLVGWAAATGHLNIPSLFLFAVVFMWTPPHFWALALVRRKDYARAGVPMLPVIRGERETRRQILIYTLELVGLTLILPVFGLGGAIYLGGAALLGLWLLHAAWNVWKTEGNKVAWKMYRYSSMYLAFLFFVLMADALL